MVGVDIHSHTFRHSFAIHPVRSDVDIRRVWLLLLGYANTECNLFFSSLFKFLVFLFDHFFGNTHSSKRANSVAD